MKLYELTPHTENGVKIYGLKDTDGNDVVVMFGHIDGMYSYCWLEGDRTKLVHLSAVTPLELYKDGYRVTEEES